jgi:hypothetical protein
VVDVDVLVEVDEPVVVEPVPVVVVDVDVLVEVEPHWPHMYGHAFLIAVVLQPVLKLGQKVGSEIEHRVVAH